MHSHQRSNRRDFIEGSAVLPGAKLLLGEAGSPEILADSLDLTSFPTIWDRLAESGISGTYYFSNVPFLPLWGFKYLGISSTYDQFLADAARGTLPAISFVDPRFTILDIDTADDDHPHTNVKRGDWFLAQTFHAVAIGPEWASTVCVRNWLARIGYLGNSVMHPSSNALGYAEQNPAIYLPGTGLTGQPLSTEANLQQRRINPDFGSVGLFYDGYYANYNAFQLDVERRLSPSCRGRHSGGAVTKHAAADCYWIRFNNAGGDAFPLPFPPTATALFPSGDVCR